MASMSPVPGACSRCSARVAARNAAAGPDARRSRGASSDMAAVIASARRSPACRLRRSAASRSSSSACGASFVSSSTAWRSHSSSRVAVAIASRAAASARSASRQSRQEVATARTSAAGTPKPSSKPRCVAGSASPICSCWPCTSISNPPSRRSRPTPTGCSPTNARERPSRPRMRRSTRSPVGSSPCSRNRSCAGCSPGSAKQAVTLACSAPARTNPASARTPSAKPRLSSRIDLPAPVSPVSTVRCGPNSRSNRSINTTSRIASAVSIRA